jgi:RNA polymerase sigma-70 factor (ECF subfamily)
MGRPRARLAAVTRVSEVSVKATTTTVTRSPAIAIAEFVDAAMSGDQEAFAHIYHAYADDVFALLTRLVGPVPEREDLLQDAFVRLHHALPKYRREAALATFLHRITVRVAYDHLRHRGRQPSFADLPSSLAASAASAEECLSQREEVGLVLDLLATLKPKQRIALVLREALELSYPEIGALVGCRPATARMRVAAAKRALRKLDRRLRRPR